MNEENKNKAKYFVIDLLGNDSPAIYEDFKSAAKEIANKLLIEKEDYQLGDFMILCGEEIPITLRIIKDEYNSE